MAWFSVERFKQPDGVARLLVALATLFALSPFFTTLRPPMQDLPQHLAAGRVLLDSAPELSFNDYFTTEWARSQYLGIYVLMGVFFHPLRLLTDSPLLWANRCAIVVLLACWVLGTEWLAQRTLRRRGVGAFALALFFNVHLILGFLNFLLGVAFAFVTLAAFAELRTRSPVANLRDFRLYTLAATALACFYFHVVPFGIVLALVIAASACDAFADVWRQRRGLDTPTIRAHWSTYAAFGPAVLALLFWLATPAGVSTREAASGGGTRGKAQYLSAAANHDALPSWTLDSFRSEWDVQWLVIVLCALVVYAVSCGGMALLERRKRTNSESVADSDVVLLWLLRLTAPACAVGYYVLPASYDWIWPINARFPLLALMFLPYWLPVVHADSNSPQTALSRTRGWLSTTFVAVLATAAVGQTVIARDAFAGFARELDGLDDILAELPKGKRVATLVFERGSRHIGFSPFLHVGAYYQAERGGVSFFSFNDFPQSPVRFRDDNRPPRVEPRWEWKPEKVRPDRDLAWFDYLIVKGGPTSLKNAASFSPVSAKGRFRLYRREQ